MKPPGDAGRRGSPCILPEETLEGYEAAIDAGVDFIEVDAVPIMRDSTYDWGFRFTAGTRTKPASLRGIGPR